MPSKEEELYAERFAKLQRLRARGVDPYPARYDRTHTSAQALQAFLDFEGAGSPAGEALNVRVAGRVTALRNMGKAAFLDLRDGEGRIQVYARRDQLDDASWETLQDTDLGDILGAEGPLFRTRAGEVTVEAAALTMLSKALQTPPEKWHGLTDTEQRYRQRYRDLIANQDARDLAIMRSKVVSEMRRFLDGRGFIEVETPVLVEQSGGAAARPFKTHHNTLDRDLYMRIATELYLKRLVVGGFEKVYEIGRIFRNEGLSFKHNPEYTMLESYEAYADYNDVMDMVEAMVSHIVGAVGAPQQVQLGDDLINLATPWRRLTLRQALIEYVNLDIETHHDIEMLKTRMIDMGMEPEPGAGWGKLVDQITTERVEQHLIQPTFLTDSPVEMAPLAKRKPDDPRYVERFEAFVGGFELANAYSELNDPLEQRERFLEQARLRAAGDDEAEIADEDFLIALEHGMPPTGGLGLGVDRLVMLLSGKRSIREVILFPTLRERH
ncbi:MAG TPA: lysine--tRNA ligase [Dehalococcoidia bacterium]|nr:lysine--tRNA ligase [Dehalococcoidia bacterium]